MTRLPGLGYIVILLCSLASAGKDKVLPVRQKLKNVCEPAELKAAAPSFGKLSPPQNLTVALLDFKMGVSWIPGQGNSPGTKYSVEIQDLDSNESQWTVVSNCTKLTAYSCYFSFPLQFDELLKHYSVRVIALQGTENSSMCYNRIIQPYGDSLLSGPRLDVDVQNELIYAKMEHLVTTVLPNITYSVNLTQRTLEKDILVITVYSTGTLWTFPSKYLDPGHFYCVSAFVNHRQQQQQHHTSQKCVFLYKPPLEKAVIQMILGTLVPLALLTLLLLVALFFYLNPRNDGVHMPSVLNEVNGTIAPTLVMPREQMAQPQLFSLESISLPSIRCPVSSCHYNSRAAIMNPNQGSTSPEPAAEGDSNAGSVSQGSEYHAVNDEEWSGSSEGLDSHEESPSCGLSDGDEASPVPSLSEDEPNYPNDTDSDSAEETQKVEALSSSGYDALSETENFECFVTPPSGYESRPDPCLCSNDRPPI
ncbi:interferon alpha/beta receptor 2-like [Arapaima gigas]